MSVRLLLGGLALGALLGWAACELSRGEAALWTLRWEPAPPRPEIGWSSLRTATRAPQFRWS